MDRFFFIVGAIVCALMGLSIIEDGILTWYGAEIQLKDSKYSVGFLFFFFSLCLLWLFLRRKKPTPKYCINCRKVVKNVVADKCPICENPTESLEGVFDRHPELKDE